MDIHFSGKTLHSNMNAALKHYGLQREKVTLSPGMPLPGLSLNHAVYDDKRNRVLYVMETADNTHRGVIALSHDQQGNHIKDIPELLFSLVLPSTLWRRSDQPGLQSAVMPPIESPTHASLPEGYAQTLATVWDPSQLRTSAEIRQFRQERGSVAGRRLIDEIRERQPGGAAQSSPPATSGNTKDVDNKTETADDPDQSGNQPPCQCQCGNTPDNSRQNRFRLWPPFSRH